MNEWIAVTTRILSFCVFLAIAACTKGPTAGVVEAKRYEPPSNFIMLMPIVISNGKTTSTIFIPYVFYDDEDFVVTIGGPNSKGEYDTKRYYVDKATYNELSVGDYFEASSHDDEDNHVKLRKASDEDKRELPEVG